jgi:hypothetical protein
LNLAIDPPQDPNGAQQAGSESLAPYQINTLTKHMLENIHSAYQSPECDKETLKVMGGQLRDESPFVERKYLESTDALAFGGEMFSTDTTNAP